MAVIKAALLGFGTVGEGVYKTIHSHEEELSAVLGRKVEVAAVLIKNRDKQRNIDPNVLVTTDFEEIIQLPQLDIIFEAIVEKEPSFTYLKRAIKRGCHIVTANKEMFAHHGKELLTLAEEHGVSVGFEATVAGGIPIIETLRKIVNINRIERIQGIVNGTSNFILTEMREKKDSFAAALSLAQKNGYAEADPTNDIEGIDAFYKLMILSNLAFGEQPDWEEVKVEGITGITVEEIELAEELGLRFKHIASIETNEGKVTGSVQPVLVSSSHPFYSIEGVENAVNIQADIVGSITLQGPGAGMFPTASAMVEDTVHAFHKPFLSKGSDKKIRPSDAENRKGKHSLWLVTQAERPFHAATLKVLTRLTDGAYIIEADQSAVIKSAERNRERSCYPILGKFDLPARTKEEILAAFR